MIFVSGEKNNILALPIPLLPEKVLWLLPYYYAVRSLFSFTRWLLVLYKYLTNIRLRRR